MLRKTICVFTPLTHSLVHKYDYKYTSTCVLNRYTQKRSLSSNSESFLTKYKSQINSAVVVGGGFLTLYGISRLMYLTTSSFMSLTPAVSLYYGFIGGAASTAIACGFLYAARDSLTMSPDHSLRLALSILRKNDQVKLLLGNSIKVLDVKLFKSISGGFAFKSGRIRWEGPQIQLIALITGSQAGKKGIVSLSCSKNYFTSSVNYLIVDIVDDKESHVNIHILGDVKLWTIGESVDSIVKSYNKILFIK